ncbi:MAG: glycogen synthase GlgA [Clostridia bacterium]|nr:glycogen synthase GlgA [Clostridia bacterium]
MIKVLFAASEAVPFIKSGGLGDVIYSLVKELRGIGIDARIMIPNYSDISFEYSNKMDKIEAFNVNVGWRRQYCGIKYLEHGGIPCYFVDNEYYFNRGGLYGYFDEAERFSFFSRGVIESLEKIDFIPDIIHLHDWHTGMIPPILEKDYPQYNHIKTVFTIHNLYYQGVFPREILGDILGLEEKLYSNGDVEFYGGVSFMKAGIKFSDIITTVSRTYADEIKTPEYGEKLDGVLRSRSSVLYGIENGIDYNLYNPKTDDLIFEKYNKESIHKKIKNKTELQKQLGLPIEENIPLIGMVTRLVKQKGIDLILTKWNDGYEIEGQLVVLGMGEQYYEEMLYSLRDRHPDKISVSIQFDDELAHKIYAASDLFLMPSLFEPCGLGQMIALRYGTLPLVRRTGGLNDTITPVNEYTGEGNGFVFNHYNPKEMTDMIDYALNIYKNEELWRRIMLNALNSDNSWKKSSEEYEKLYKKLMGRAECT